MTQHSIMLRFNEPPKGRVLITSRISKGNSEVKVYDIDFSEHEYRLLDVDIIEVRGKE